MRPKLFALLSSFYLILLISWNSQDNGWMTHQYKGYRILYKVPDKNLRKEYNKLIKNGIKLVYDFFGKPYPNKFDVYLHPDRHSMDSSWQKDWNLPNFKSECWMVASGVATRLDMLSPQKWEQEACEHNYADALRTQRLITHELVHVFHGQQNPSPDFSNVEGIDWFVEGLATYASGQCDSMRIVEVKNAIYTKKIPGELDKFWTGNIRYGLAGSVVMYIDNQYGREKLKELLPINKKSEILTALNTTEAAFLNEWKNFVLKK